MLGLRRDAFELATTDRWAFAVYAVLVVGVIEETAKLQPFALIVMRFEHFDEPIDGIIYASFIALGFAAYENVHYMFLVSPMEAVLRGFASPLVQAVFASIWGYMGARDASEMRRLAGPAARARRLLTEPRFVRLFDHRNRTLATRRFCVSDSGGVGLAYPRDGNAR